MCGIAGIINNNQSFDTKSLLLMSDSLKHRGPDDHGFLLWNRKDAVTLCKDITEQFNKIQVAFIHRRLSIIDLTSTGWQPMGTADGRYFIVFNGEIYNYLELRAELIKLGWSFSSSSDTEVLLTGYAQWGSKVLDRLVGMFAFTILDAVKHRLFIARDCFGIKPLFYSYWNGGFAFASEIKALLALPNFDRGVNPNALYEYLRFGISGHGEETLFRNIYQLPAAHYLEVSLDRPYCPETTRYWQLDLRQQSRLCFRDAAYQLREMFIDNVRLHMRSDVPVGAALSGGIDSSSIVMAMRQIEPEVDLNTFSYIADESVINEERWVDIVTLNAGTSTHKISLSPEELIEDLESLIAIQDEPFGSTSIYAQYRIFRLAKEVGIKVMLDGQGADELLAGYTLYNANRIESLLHQRDFIGACSLFYKASKLPHVKGKELLSYLIWKFLPENLVPSARLIYRKKLIPPWINAGWFLDKSVEFKEPIRSSQKNTLRHELYRSLGIGLQSLLRYEDRNSMAYSIESRVPFLTTGMAEFVLSLPENYLISNDGTSKCIFRAAMRDIVPDKILERRDKIRFQTPEMRWFSFLRPWIEDVLQSKTAKSIPVLNNTCMTKEWKEIVDGNRKHDEKIWRWINIILWADINCVCFS